MTVADSELDGIYRRGLLELAAHADRTGYPLAGRRRARTWLGRMSAAVVFAGVIGFVVLGYAAGHRSVETTAPGSAASAGGAAAQQTAAAAPSVPCSSLSEVDVYKDAFTVEPPGGARPAVSCAAAVATAKAACPLNGRPCGGAPMPQVAVLSLIKDYPDLTRFGYNPNPRLVWAVTWAARSTPSGCSLPPGFSPATHPGKAVGPEGNWWWTSGSRIDPAGACHWVTFVDAATGKEMMAALEIGCARMPEGPYGSECNPAYNG